MRGLILTNAFVLSDSFKQVVKSLIYEFKEKGVEVDVKSLNNIDLYINKDYIESNFKDYSFCIFLDKDQHLAELLEKSGMRMFNKARPIHICDDKMLTYIYLANNGIRMPKTISHPLCYYENSDTSSFQKRVLEELSLPLIIKENYGSLGRQVYLVNTEEEFYKLSNELKTIPHLYQEFIDNSKGKDIRVIVIGHKVIASMKRENKEDFRSNIALGGTGTPIYNLDKEFEDAAIKVSKILDLDYCGVDLLIDKDNKPVVCEVNSNAFFNEISKITKVNVSKAYVEYILDSFEN